MPNSAGSEPGRYSRRHFLRETVLGAGALGALGLSTPDAPAANEGIYAATQDAGATRFDFTAPRGSISLKVPVRSKPTASWTAPASSATRFAV